MKYLIFSFSALINVPFALNGDFLNILVIGFIAGLAVASAIADIDQCIN